MRVLLLSLWRMDVLPGCREGELDLLLPCLACVSLSFLSYGLDLYFWGARAKPPLPALPDGSEEA